MSRYIDADELKRNHMFYHEVDNRSYAEERDIDETPKVDAVPVVRCGECIHRYVDGENVRFNVCELNHNKVQADDWFCADGERRTE